MKKILLTIGVVLFMVLIIRNFLPSPPSSPLKGEGKGEGGNQQIKISESDSKVTINSATFIVTIAKTPEQQIRGLSGVTKMPEDHGMLFVFDKPGHNSFWMHGMKFPLDIIFMSKDKVVGVYENLPPAKDEDLSPPTWGGNDLSDHALEINAGMAKKFNIKVGDVVTFQIK